MKNIHILPTDKPSRLVLRDVDMKLVLHTPITQWHGKSQTIHITSNEEIKDEDLVLIGNTIGKVSKIKYPAIGGSSATCVVSNYKSSTACLVKDCKKIILTDNEDLIKDGVQAIDDEFLEWFVKNPSCEEVEVVLREKEECDCYYTKFCKSERLDTETYCRNIEKHITSYKIIIPKEVPKQRVFGTKDDKQFWSDKPKQETLEEAIDRISKEDGYDIDGAKVADFVDGMVKGAKWQAEGMYSEQDMNAIFHFGHTVGMNSVLAIQSKHSPQPMPEPDLEILKAKWFEQFKKK